MGVSSSKIEEDKALKLCRDRRKFVREALDGRCSLAATHVTYIQSLRNVGIALRKFVETEAPTESSLYTSTTATPEPLALTDKSLSQLSYSSPSLSQHVDALSPSPSPPYSGRLQANYMKARGSSSTKVEERLPSSVIRTLKSSSSDPHNLTPRSDERPETSVFDLSPSPLGTPAWDYFDPFDRVYNQSSFQDARELDYGLDDADDMRRLREEEGIPELEDEEKVALTGQAEFMESEDEFDDPSTENLVQSFENRNRVMDSYSTSASPNVPSARATAETKDLNEEKSNSPDLTPLKNTPSVVSLPSDIKKTSGKESEMETKLAPKDFLSTMKDIETLFLKASESGKEVPRMLEANKLHFRPIVSGKEGGSRASIFFKACFSCGEEPTQIPEEPAQTGTKYLTWHRTESSRSSSSRNPLGSNSKDNIGDISGNLFENFCMISGSHASTMDRLYAWERKLYDEVKASGIIRRDYDMMCRLLRQQESRGESHRKIDKTRAVVKDLHSRIRVAIHRIDSISKKIEELRDQELQPQLEELIKGLKEMWGMMFDCHKLQLNIISISYINGSAKSSLQSESHREATMYLECELSNLSSSFSKWISAQEFYLRSINEWLYKCVLQNQEKSSRRRRRVPAPSLRDQGPVIYFTCGVWLENLENLPTKEVAESIKLLAAETTRFLPLQEKNQGKSLNQSFPLFWKAGSRGERLTNTAGYEPVEDWVSGFDRFRSSVVGFLDHLNSFAESSLKLYADLEKGIADARKIHDKATIKPQA